MSEPSLTASSDQSDSEITLGVLNAVDRNEKVTQRGLANDLGIALGLANAYIKRCAKKGLIKVSQAPARRYAYYLTPKGFAEKSRLTAAFLSQSLHLFRLARDQYSRIVDECAAARQSRLAIFGSTDLAEIILLCTQDRPVKVVGIVDQRLVTSSSNGVPVVDSVDELPEFDVILLADLRDPQKGYDELEDSLGAERIAVPAFLNVSKRQIRNQRR